MVRDRSATGTPVALTLETGKAMPSATTRGASFYAILRGFDTRTFTAFDFELFICKLLFIPIDTTSRRQRTNYQLKALTATPTATTSLDGHVPHFPLPHRSEEHTSELQSLMRISYAVFCLKKNKRHVVDDVMSVGDTEDRTSSSLQPLHKRAY